MKQQPQGDPASWDEVSRKDAKAQRKTTAHWEYKKCSSLSGEPMKALGTPVTASWVSCVSKDDIRSIEVRNLELKKIMKKKILVMVGVFFPIVFFLMNLTAMAGFLKIETRTSVQVDHDVLKAHVTITNNGSDSAFNLQVHLKALNRLQDGLIKPQLDPGMSDSFLFEMPLSDVTKGRYPLTVLVDFHDANQYPFSALSGMGFYVGEDANPNLIVKVDPVSMKKKQDLVFHLKNLGTNPLQAEATLALPKELSSKKQENRFQIGPRSEKTLNFQISNFSALAGASYPVYCFFEYESEGVHHTAIASSMVTILKEESWFRRFRWMWVSLAVLLGLVFVGMLVKGRKKGFA